MSAFWSVWVTVITLAVILGCTWLLLATRKSEKYKDATEETVGHAFDGIEEYDNPLPSWWFNLFIGTVVFGLLYLVAYPGLGSFPGLLGWTSTNQYEDEVLHAEETYQPVFAKYAAFSVDDLMKPENDLGLAMGQRMFGNNCAVCHGADAQGSYGFPNLTDNDWLYGGSFETIKQTITAGRNVITPSDVKSMPAWGQSLGEDAVRDLTAYVLTLDGNTSDAMGNPVQEEAASRGKAVFQSNCTACHGADAKGLQALGAPNLTDDIWLYGGSYAQVAHTIRKGRKGIMPAHDSLISEDKIHLIAAYVYSLSNK